MGVIGTVWISIDLNSLTWMTAFQMISYFECEPLPHKIVWPFWLHCWFQMHEFRTMMLQVLSAVKSNISLSMTGNDVNKQSFDNAINRPPISWRNSSPP